MKTRPKTTQIRKSISFRAITRAYGDTVGILFPKGIVKWAGIRPKRKVTISLSQMWIAEK